MIRKYKPKRIGYTTPNIKYGDIQYGAGVVQGLASGKVATFLKNAVSKIDPGSRPSFKGEAHLPLFIKDKYGLRVGIMNYGGPGTQIAKRLLRGDKPRNTIDEISQAHDIRYALAKDVKDVRDADNIFLKAMKKNKKKIRPVNYLLVSKGMKGKIALEDKGVFARDKFAPSHESYTPRERTTMVKKLAELEQKGFGKKKIKRKKKKLLPAKLLIEQMKKKAGRGPNEEMKHDEAIKNLVEFFIPKMIEAMRVKRILDSRITELNKDVLAKKIMKQKGGSVTGAIISGAIAIASTVLPIIIGAAKKIIKKRIDRNRAKKKLTELLKKGLVSPDILKSSENARNLVRDIFKDI